jgi:signal transduction histidine kinase
LSVIGIEGEFWMAGSVAGGGISHQVLTPEVRARIMRVYVDRLTEMGSPIVGNPVWLAQARRQAEGVLDDLACAETRVEAEPGQGDVDGDDRLSEEIGSARAMAGVHPGESLGAASVFFAVVVEQVALLEPAEVAALSVALHSSIMRRIGEAALSYASFLLKKVHNSHLEERRRMARELHDRAAHELGVGLQSLELHGIYADDQPERSAAKLETAKNSLREALRTVRALSAELGSAVGTEGLFAALHKYLNACVPPDITVRCVCTGDDRMLSEILSEELYLVLREAVRNALVHGDPGWLELTLDLGGGSLRGVVRDDGCGFDVETAMGESHGIGLSSMRERMELLGGTLTVTSSRGVGATVEVSVQIPDRAR